jgi:dimethylglycine dehydrogenase
MRWFERHLPGTARCGWNGFGQKLVGLALAGPRSRAVLEGLADVDVSNAAFRFMDFREMDVAGAPRWSTGSAIPAISATRSGSNPATCARSTGRSRRRVGPRASRISGCGRCCRCGSRRTSRPGSPNCARSTGRSKAAMDRFVGWTRTTSSAARRRRASAAEGPRLRRVSFAIDAADADVMADEPVWARGVEDYGAVAAPHGVGAPRYDAGGAETLRRDGRRDGDWRVVGWVTSGGFAHHVGLSMAQGYVPARWRNDRNGALRDRDPRPASARPDPDRTALRSGWSPDADVTVRFF